MEELSEDYYNQIIDIKEEVSSLRKELNRFLEQSNHHQLQFLLSQMEQRYSKGLMDYVMEDASQRLATNMNPDCKMRETCESQFKDLLTDMSNILGTEKVRQETMKIYQDRFDKLKKKANTQNCDRCVAEVSNIFKKEMDLIRSLKVYESTDDGGNNIFDLPEEEVVKQFCEPLANKQRIGILKALATETKSFSQLSNLTKLRGGNLLFHLQKLLDTGMILQHDERGDYMIAAKGYEALKDLSRMYSRLGTRV